MPSQPLSQTGAITETIRGIVDRVTYHNPDNGWSVLRVSPFNNPHQQETVIVHQTKVFAGATMEFHGAWTVHPKFGRQFKAIKTVERKPATAAALEKYLGSGLIKGVGPKTAKKIVNHFGGKTLDVFEGEIGRLTEIRGIAQKKLEMIRDAWTEHRAIREVMMFLQSHGISTLFAVRIYKEYGDNAIAYVTEDPYRLASDFYGIGFFSSDKVAQSIGLALDSPQRIMAAIKHVLAASREFGHCYLTQSQIRAQVKELIELDLGDRLPDLLKNMEQENLVMVREIETQSGAIEPCYYSKSLYFDELFVARKIQGKHENDSGLNLYEFRTDEPLVPYETELTIPEKFRFVDIEKICRAETRVDELLAVLKKVHPWSSLHYGLSATDVVKKLYLEWIEIPRN